MLLRTLLLIATLSLTACDFQLRGANDSVQLSFDRVRLKDVSNDQKFSQLLEQHLKSTGIEISATAQTSLELLSTQQQKRTAAYSSRGKSSEYELIKEATFQLKQGDTVLIPKTTLKVRRSYLYRETAAVGKAEEERLLYNEMSQELAQRLLLSLQRAAIEEQP